MQEYIKTFQSLMERSPFFWFAALVGTGMFIIQLALSLVGAGDHDTATDHSGSETDSIQIKWLSKQAIAGFLMMFGWAGLTCLNQFHLTRIVATVVACSTGVVAVVVNGLIFKLAKKLHSPGTIFRMEDAIGRTGVVYQRIPEHGVGKVTVSVQGITREVDAVSNTSGEITSFTSVEVVSKKDNQTLVVKETWK
jgi:hypothetical protein